MYIHIVVIFLFYHTIVKRHKGQTVLSHFSLSCLFIPLFGGGEVTLKVSLSPGEVTLKLSRSPLVDGSCCTAPLEVDSLLNDSSLDQFTCVSVTARTC